MKPAERGRADVAAETASLIGSAAPDDQGSSGGVEVHARLVGLVADQFQSCLARLYHEADIGARRRHSAVSSSARKGGSRSSKVRVLGTGSPFR